MKNSQETKKVLSNTLKELMTKKDFEKISIKEITNIAGVNRQTFYYHFEDIYDLLKWTIQQEAVPLIDVHESAKAWQEGLLQLMHYLEDNKAFCLCALKSLGHEDMKRFFYSDIYNIVHRVVYDIGEKYESNDDYLAFLTHFFTLSLGAIVTSWLNDETEQTPEELIEMIDLFIEDHLRGVEQRFLANKK